MTRISSTRSDAICDLLRHCTKPTEWMQWLISNQNEGAKQTRRFLNVALDCVAQSERSRFEKSLFKRPGEQIGDLIRELITHQIFFQHGYRPTLLPQLPDSLTPDLAVDIKGEHYLVEVFVMNSPSNTLFSSETNGEGAAKDSGERARKVAQRINEKATKYAKCDTPLIVVVFLGDHQILDTWNIEQGLYGVAISEFGPTDLYPINFNFEIRMGGCILPVKNELTPLPGLSAVVVCDWFDTLNRDAPGKRISCTVLHHYNPRSSFPAAALAPFQEVSWEKSGIQSWKPCFSGQSNIVARLGADGGFEYGLYSANKPW